MGLLQSGVEASNSPRSFEVKVAKDSLGAEGGGAKLGTSFCKDDTNSFSLCQPLPQTVLIHVNKSKSCQGMPMITAQTV